MIGSRRLLALATLFGMAILGSVLAAGAVWGAEGDVSRISLGFDGSEGDEDSLLWGGSLSDDGRYVAFVSSASNIVPDDTNGHPDVFVHDRQTGDTIRVSVSSSGDQGNGNSSFFEASLPRISADGRHVVFISQATNLVPGDNNGSLDVFVHDLDTAETSRASFDSSGIEANGSSLSASTSGDGRYVAFTSSATNLVPGDTNAVSDAFVHDRLTGDTARVSVAGNGDEANQESSLAAISANGRHVAFASEADNLVPGDGNGQADVFVRDRQTGATTRLSVSSNGTEANGVSGLPSVSANGRYVLFSSSATNLVPGDGNGAMDAFYHDRQTGETTRVSVTSNGAEGDADSMGTDLSADGRHVVFDTAATNLVPDDTNASYDVMVHDRQTGETTRVSVAEDGTEGDADSQFPAISGDGRYVSFGSDATNLVPGDGNGWTDVYIHQYLADPPSPTTTTSSTTSTTMPASSGDYFVDDDGNIFETAIDWLYEQGITTGCNPPVNDRFCPDDHVSRGEMAAFLARAFGYGDDGGGGHFVDTVGHVFETAADRLYVAGVTVGCNPPVNDRFCPDDFVTRGQMAAFLVRAFGYTDDGGGDRFVDDDGSVFELAIDRLGTAGVTLGCNPPVNDRYCPEDFVTRGQMAAFLKRGLQGP
jgi:Tol biopolymer transport system component